MFGTKNTIFRLCQYTLKIPIFSTRNTLNLNALKRNHSIGWSYTTGQILPIRLNFFQAFRSNCTKTPLNTNVKVNNNVMLYKYEKVWIYRLATAFGLSAIVGCLSMSNNVYMVLCKDLFNKEKNLSTRLQEHILPLLLISVGIVAAPVISFVIWYITVRTVKYIVLLKGSNLATLITYHPIKGERAVTIPINTMSCVASRLDKSGFLHIKVKNNKYKYIVEKAGVFVNPELFDATVGASRF